MRAVAGLGSAVFGLIRSHLSGPAITNDDLTDLSKLQLDMVISIDVEDQRPVGATWAHIVPDNPAGKQHAIQSVASRQ